MTTSADAFTVAAALSGGRELSSTQQSQLRAINRKYYQRMFELLHQEPADDDMAGEATTPAAPSVRPSKRRELTKAEAAELHQMLERDVREVLDPSA